LLTQQLQIAHLLGWSLRLQLLFGRHQQLRIGRGGLPFMQLQRQQSQLFAAPAR
jgi:hypothetical protein